MSDPTQAELERRIALLSQQVERLERRRLAARAGRVLRWAARPRHAAALGVAAVLVPLAAWAVTLPHTFSNGTIADADEVNENFAALAQAIGLHVPDPAAHHVKTLDASELVAGTLDDARLSPSVSLLGPGIDAAELEFDPATQVELDAQAGAFGVHALDPAAHHPPYDDAQAIAAVGPHVTSVDGLGGGTVTGPLDVDGLVSSTTGGVRFPDASVQTTAFEPGLAAVFPSRILVAQSGGDFTSIQAAIDSVSPSASDPALIDVAAGVYTESIVLKSHVHVRGAGMDATVIANPPGFGTQVDATGVVGATLSHLSVYDDPFAGDASEYGLALDSGSSIDLVDVRVDGQASAQVRALGGTLRARWSHFGSLEVDRPAVQLDAGATATFESSSFASIDECVIESTDARLTLSRSEVLANTVCSRGGTPLAPSIVHLFHNRLSNVRVGEPGGGCTEGEIVGNRIDADFGFPVVVDSGCASRIVGNHVVSREAGAQSVALIRGGAQVSGNLIENTDPATGAGQPVIGVFGDDGWVIVGNTLRSAADGGLIGGDGDATVIGNRLESAFSDVVLVGGTVLANTQSPQTPQGQALDYWRAGRDLEIEVPNRMLIGYGGSGSSTGELTISGPGGTLVFDPGAGATISAGGSTLTMDASGDVSLSAAGNLTLSGVDVTIAATGALDVASGAGTTLDATGPLAIQGATIGATSATGMALSSGTLLLSSSGAAAIGVDGTLSITADTIDATGASAVDLESFGTFDVRAAAELDVSSSAIVDVNGSLITLN